MLGYVIERTCGCAVVTAPNGEEATHLTLGQRPAAVVLDVDMPGIGGTEAARTLRASLQESAPLLMALTYAEGQSRAHQAGVFDHVLGKPVEIEVLTALLEGSKLGRTA